MQLINIGPTEGMPNIIPPEWLHISKMMELNIEYVKRYYNSSNTAVNSNHILVEIIKNINIPFVIPLDRYSQLLLTKATRCASNMNLTTAYGKGKVFQNQFFNDSYEIIIGHDESFDYNKAYSNWTRLEPVEILKHSETNLDLPILDGKTRNLNNTTNVISVNIVMLGIMYKAFMDNEISKNLPTTKSIMQFIRMYVLPGMIRSYVNISLFNRLSNFKIGIKEPIVDRNAHSFYMPVNLDKRIDFVLKSVLNELEKKSLFLSGILSNIPKFSNNKFIYTEVPETLINRQQLWALLYSKLNTYITIFEYNKTNPSYNKTYLNELKRMVQFFMNNNEHNTLMTFSENLLFKENLEYLLTL